MTHGDGVERGCATVEGVAECRRGLSVQWLLFMYGGCARGGERVMEVGGLFEEERKEVAPLTP
jgi:hypothetical protein